ncbi:MAG: formate dehydrogenase accessory sulfurtransferase FdhD [Candidatus Hydrothermarchaeales archaeon]
MLKKVDLKRIFLDKDSEEREEHVIEDKIYWVKVDGETKFRLVTISQDVLAAGIGRLLGEGIINSIEELDGHTLKGSTLEFKIKGKSKSRKKTLKDLTVEKTLIFDCVKRMVKESKIWRLTGGMHAAGLFNLQGEMLYFVEDIGKVTAVDKLIGKAALDGTDLSESILVSTGRIVGGIVAKTVRAGIPIVVSKSAPMYSSIEVAEKEGITLVCFARGRRMNVYTHPERIISS